MSKTPNRNLGPWVPAMNRWCDQTGTAHLLRSDSGIARPLCGARIHMLGGWFASAELAGAHPCRACTRAALAAAEGGEG